MPRQPQGSTSAVVTIPNALSLARIASIPVFAALIVHRGTEAIGLVVFGVVASTDWVDGYIARHTRQVSEIGKVLDPVADRLAIAALIVAVLVRGLFPVWAALLVVLRDAAVLLAAAILSVRWRVRIDVRRIGKAATLAVMLGIPFASAGMLDLTWSAVAAVFGWSCFAVGIALYYAAAVAYAVDASAAVGRSRRSA